MTGRVMLLVVLLLGLASSAQAQSIPFPGPGMVASAATSSGWVITDQGTSSTVAGATVAVTPTATITSGSLVVLAVDEEVTGGIGTVTDSASNNYAAIVSNRIVGAAAGWGAIFYSVLTTQLPKSGTITYTKNTSGATASTTVLSATGNTASPLDAAVTATASNSTTGSTTPSVTSGTPAVSGELFVGIVVAHGVTGFTVDTGNGWATPPDFSQFNSGNRGAMVGGGSLTNAGTGTKTHAPVLGTSRQWTDYIVGFKPL